MKSSFLVVNILFTVLSSIMIYHEVILSLVIILFLISPFLAISYFGMSAYNGFGKNSGQITELILLQSFTVLFIVGISFDFVKNPLLILPIYLITYLSVSTTYIEHHNKTFYYFQKYGVITGIIVNLLFIYQEPFSGSFVNAPFFIFLSIFYGKFYRDLSLKQFFSHFAIATGILSTIIILYHLIINNYSFPEILNKGLL